MQAALKYPVPPAITKKISDYIFAVDFDGTCVMHDYPEVGADVPGAVETLKWLADQGGKIILWTMRSDKPEVPVLTDAVTWFKDRDIPLYGINTCPGQKGWTDSPKAYAHVYIDDAALGAPLISDPELCDRPFIYWAQVRLWIEKVCIFSYGVGMAKEVK